MADTSPSSPQSLQLKKLVDGPAVQVTLRPRLVRKKEKKDAVKSKTEQTVDIEDQAVTEKDNGKEQAGKKEQLRNISSTSLDYGNYA